MGTHDLDQTSTRAKSQTVPTLVHESEAQRQHARVRLPGQMELLAPAGAASPIRFPLNDLSAGGVSFTVSPSQVTQFRPGVSLRGQIAVSVDGIAITIPVSCRVMNTDAQSGRIGAQFLELGPKEIAALRHLISAFLAGEIVSVGELLHTLGRDNQTRARTPPRPIPNTTAFGRIRAVALTALLLALGLGALGYTVGQLQHSLLVVDAEAAKVAGTVFTISMPREGTFFSLIPEDGIVKKGAALGSFEAAALDLVRAQAVSPSLSPEQLDRMLAQSVKGTISSPCDCRVQARFVGDNQYVSRGDALMELTPLTGVPHVLARFSYQDADRLQQGVMVRFRVSGDPAMREGKVSQVRVTGGSESVDSDLLVTVLPTEPLPIALVNHPVRVSIGESYSLPSLLPVALAMQRDRH